MKGFPAGIASLIRTETVRHAFACGSSHKLREQVRVWTNTNIKLRQVQR
jgi:hypothetical protein